MSHVTLMEGDKPSTKRYDIDPITNSAKKGLVEQAYLHDSYTIPINNLIDLYDVISYAREESHRYIIRGSGLFPKQELVRRTKYNDIDGLEGKFREVATSWICCDFDKYLVPETLNRTSIEAIEWLIQNELPDEFHNVSYIYQWSASAGLVYDNKPIKEGTNVHIFFYLNTSLTVDQYKIWFHDEIERGFDASTFNTVTPIFVNSHVEKDDRIIDIIDEQSKFGIVAKDNVEVIAPEIREVVKDFSTFVTDIDLSNEIMATLRDIGAIYGKRSGWVLLKHPREKTPGDWHLKPNSPQVIHHHVQKSMRIDKWIKEYYGLDKKFKFPDNRINQLTREASYDRYMSLLKERETLNNILREKK
jgi:hypothetical protein